MLRVQSPLPPEQERIVEQAIDSAFAVHTALGPGFREKIYARAYQLELSERTIRFECVL